MAESFLSDSVQFIKGVGSQRAKLLKKIGILSIEDALYYLPYRYEDRRSLRKICELESGFHMTVRGEVAFIEEIRIPKRKMNIVELTVSDGSGIVKAKWFNQPYMKKTFKKGQNLFLSGIVRTNKFHGIGYEMENPDYETIDDSKYQFIHTSRIVPVYRTTAGMGQRMLRSFMYNVVHGSIPKIKEYIPDEILKRNSLMRLDEAIKGIHFPEKTDERVELLNSGTSQYHRRLVFDELFLFQIGVTKIKMDIEKERGLRFYSPPALTGKLLDALPFKLTSSQKRVWDDIYIDMMQDKPMNRLIQGDVGSGKTVIALLAMLKAVECGYMAAMMVPTEILAQQHFINIMNLLDSLDVKCRLITSKIKEGDDIPDIVIGTHALIQENITFNNLGLVVVDEQHRFGVRQRALLRKKGHNPDVLVMTATPIPRTLAMTLYGDLDHSVIDELPPGRTPVETLSIKEAQKQMVYDLIKKEVMSGGQCYVVYPVIEEDDSSHLRSAEMGCEAMRGLFPTMRIELVHGRMNPDERQTLMDEFRDAKIHILICTTVIEVGVDVPNATVMVIVHAERFGLAQLHQLRGRVGRGKRKSYCILLSYGNPSEDAERRIKAMINTTDGFKIAEEDLDIRGPGDFFGTAQSGYPELMIANIIRDSLILETAKKESSGLLAKEPYLENYPVLRSKVRRMWRNRAELYKTV